MVDLPLIHRDLSDVLRGLTCSNGRICRVVDRSVLSQIKWIVHQVLGGIHANILLVLFWSYVIHLHCHLTWLLKLFGGAANRVELPLSVVTINTLIIGIDWGGIVASGWSFLLAIAHLAVGHHDSGSSWIIVELAIAWLCHIPHLEGLDLLIW